MRKSTIISPCFLAQRPVGSISTDYIRAYMKHLFLQVGGDPQKIEMSELPELRPHDDTIAWIGTTGLIKLLNHQQKDALIEGIAIPPTGVRDLERGDPNLKVRAAFMGYSKPVEFQPPEWTSELETLIEAAIGKANLNSHLKKYKGCDNYKEYDWIYKDEHGKPSPYNDSGEAGRIRDAVEAIRVSGSENFKYFNLIDYIPRERRGEDPAILRLEDHINVAIDIRSFLLK